uniref:C-type lectin domain-containing protein n=1 Tax=Amphiprion ocellaris TaxID=80972 RepID=A0AAQ5ZWS3_AMPOC
MPQIWSVLMFIPLLCGILMYIFSIFSAHSQCLEGWRDYEGKCYFFSTDTKTWTEANAFCSEQNNLVSITTAEENQFVSSPTGISLWMGGHDSVTEGGWEWTDGSPFRYIRWNAGNPDNYDGEDCLSILVSNGYWNDDKCENKRGYICKRRGEKSCSNCC